MGGGQRRGGVVRVLADRYAQVHGRRAHAEHPVLGESGELSAQPDLLLACRHAHEARHLGEEALALWDVVRRAQRRPDLLEALDDGCRLGELTPVGVVAGVGGVRVIIEPEAAGDEALGLGAVPLRGGEVVRDGAGGLVDLVVPGEKPNDEVSENTLLLERGVGPPERGKRGEVRGDEGRECLRGAAGVETGQVVSALSMLLEEES